MSVNWHFHSTRNEQLIAKTTGELFSQRNNKNQYFSCKEYHEGAFCYQRRRTSGKDKLAQSQMAHLSTFLRQRILAWRCIFTSQFAVGNGPVLSCAKSCFEIRAPHYAGRFFQLHNKGWLWLFARCVCRSAMDLSVQSVNIAKQHSKRWLCFWLLRHCKPYACAKCNIGQSADLQNKGRQAGTRLHSVHAIFATVNIQYSVFIIFNRVSPSAEKNLSQHQFIMKNLNTGRSSFSSMVAHFTNIDFCSVWQITKPSIIHRHITKSC